MLDYNFGNISQEIPVTISHSAEGADFNTLALTNQNFTFQSSTFPQSTDQERHWNVNSTAGTNAQYVSSNTVQNENSDYFNSSQLIPPAQYFENSDCTSGAENPAMAFSTTASTTTLNPFELICPNNSAWMQHDPNLSFYNELPPTSQGIEDPSNYLTIYDSTNEYYNLSMNMQSGQSAMQDSDISRFQDKEYRSMAIARKSDRREENTKCASDLSITSINEQYHGNSRVQNSSHMAALKHASTSINTIMREKEFLNIRNSAYRNIDNIDSYSILHFGKGFLDSRQGRKEISHKYYKSQGQFADKMKFQNVFQCHFCGSYQRNLKDRELRLNSSNVPFKCNECIETMKLKEKIQHCPKFAEVGDERSANKLQKKTKVLNKRFSCNLCSKRITSQKDLDRHKRSHTGEKPFSCVICHKKFSQKGNKDVHTLTHSENKRFQCNVCGSSFTSNQNLLKHKLKHLADN